MNPTPTVREAMTGHPVEVSPQTRIQTALDLLLEHAVSGLPVVDAHGNVVGIVTERDCLDAVYEASYHLDPGRSVGETMTRQVQTVDADMDIVDAIDLFRTSPYRRFPVLDGTRLVGVLSRRDVLRALRDVAGP